MIPDSNDDGYLPSGVHPAMLNDIERRFRTESELRRLQMQSIYWLVELARKAGVRRIVPNGSFVTDAYEPNEVDCADATEELENGLPFLEVLLNSDAGFRKLVETFFTTDRDHIPKGMGR